MLGPVHPDVFLCSSDAIRAHCFSPYFITAALRIQTIDKMFPIIFFFSVHAIFHCCGLSELSDEVPIRVYLYVGVIVFRQSRGDANGSNIEHTPEHARIFFCATPVEQHHAARRVQEEEIAPVPGPGRQKEQAATCMSNGSVTLLVYRSSRC